jgi:hypothetical protein
MQIAESYTVKPDERFLKQDKSFWANVRTISQGCGYTDRATSEINVPTLDAICELYESLDLNVEKLRGANRRPTPFGQTLLDYFQHRATVLNNQVRQDLMTLDQARQLFNELAGRFGYRLALEERGRGANRKIEAFLIKDDTGVRFQIAMNKQKGEKKAPAYFTGIIAMLIKNSIGDHPCNFNPLQLTSVTRDGVPLRTLARRVDGTFPRVINPIAIWEIKEYYYTTTFGSRVADGVYESLLDGLELEELRDTEEIDVKHYLMLDDHNTWWNMGRSYLCRAIDMLHMEYVDEIFFGRDVVNALPAAVAEWLKHPALDVPQEEAEDLL